MKVFLRRSITKVIVATLLIAGVVLLCPVNLLSSSSVISYGANTVSVSGHNNAADNAGQHNSKTHPEVVDHIASLLTVFNDFAVLFFAALIIFTLFFYQSLFLASESYFTKLKFRLRYGILIKSKIEKIFLRWLNLLGGTFASSF